jgi:hypothetical protein
MSDGWTRDWLDRRYAKPESLQVVNKQTSEGARGETRLMKLQCAQRDKRNPINSARSYARSSFGSMEMKVFTGIASRVARECGRN